MPRRPETASSGWVYLLRHSSGVYKIGITLNPKSRFKQLKVGNSNQLVEASITRNPGAVEKQLQTRYASKRLPQSEYFALNDQDIREITSLLNNVGFSLPLKAITSILASTIFFFILFCIGAFIRKDDWRDQVAIETGEMKIVPIKTRKNNRSLEIEYGTKTLYNSLLPPLLEISDINLKRRDLHGYGINSHHWDAYYKITNKSDHYVRRIRVTASYLAKEDYYTDSQISSYPECMSPGETIDGDRLWLSGLASLNLSSIDMKAISFTISEANFCN